MMKMTFWIKKIVPLGNKDLALTLFGCWRASLRHCLVSAETSQGPLQASVKREERAARGEQGRSG